MALVISIQRQARQAFRRSFMGTNLTYKTYHPSCQCALRSEASGGANQFLNRGTMRLRCMSTLKTAAEPPCTTASGAYLSPRYGFGPPATIWRNRGAEHRRARKCLSANEIRLNLCDAAAR